MTVNIILNRNNEIGILAKMANQLCSQLTLLGIRSAVTRHPVSGYELYHFMSYAFVEEVKFSHKGVTFFITHLDDIFKITQVKSIINKYGYVGICMSFEMKSLLISKAVPACKLQVILPATDNEKEPRRIVIGITTKIYSDGRKREWILRKLSQEMKLDAFTFKIFGNGWQDVILHLESSGAHVEYQVEHEDYKVEYERILHSIPSFDYYLYLGMDEGSIGTIDALRSGIPCIVTPQGFHLDISSGIEYWVNTYDDVKKVFQNLNIKHKNRISSVVNLTYKKYTLEHVNLWNKLQNNENIETEFIYVHPKNIHNSVYLINSLKLRRILSHFSRLRIFSKLRTKLTKVNDK